MVLPYDVSAIIISILVEGLERLSPYATVSRDWQHLIEKHTFAGLRITSNDLLLLSRIVTPERANSVRQVDFTIELVNYNNPALLPLQRTASEQDQNSRLFSDSIKQLFQILQRWPPVPSLNNTATYYEAADCPRYPGRSLYLTSTAHTSYDGQYSDFENMKAPCSRTCLRLTSSDEIPEVFAISSLMLDRDGWRMRLSMQSFLAICTRLKSLQVLVGTVWDTDERLITRRRDRFDFAQGLYQLSPSLREIDLTFFDNAPVNHDCKPPSLLLPTSSTPQTSRLPLNSDFLSSGFRHISQQLVRLIIFDGVLGPALFWPVDSTLLSETDLPWWPHLREMTIQLPPTTPKGAWLFSQDPKHSHQQGYDEGNDRFGTEADSSGNEADSSTLSHSFRTHSIAKYFDRLYLSVGRAAKRMPRVALIQVNCGGHGIPFQEFVYDTVLNHDGYRNKEAQALSVNFVRWRNEFCRYRPSGEVMSVWKATAGADAMFEVTNSDR